MHKREEFYAVELEMKDVSKEEFMEFIDNYPRKLTPDVFGAYEPPLITYNDFELANRWPYSIVAKTLAYDDRPGDYYYTAPERRHYYIAVNYEEAFNSKTGFKA